MKFERGKKLKKIYDGSIVTIRSIGSDYITLDGDFEPNHVVMKDKVSTYYQEIH